MLYFFSYLTHIFINFFIFNFQKSSRDMFYFEEDIEAADLMSFPNIKEMISQI